MKNKIILLALSSFVMSSAGAAGKSATPSPVQSKEEIEFLSKKDQNLIDVAKTDDFAGIITRPNQSNPALKTIDLYTFQDVKPLNMDKTLCSQLLERLFGPVKESSLKISEPEIFNSHTGKTCEVQVKDPDAEGKIPERRVLIGFVNAKPIGLVFRFPKPSDKAAQQNARDFWSTLR